MDASGDAQGWPLIANARDDSRFADAGESVCASPPPIHQRKLFSHRQELGSFATGRETLGSAWDRRSSRLWLWQGSHMVGRRGGCVAAWRARVSPEASLASCLRQIAAQRMLAPQDDRGYGNI
jgi:hypothetical protein